jgi:PST family polysaccharide transporter
LPLFPKVGHAEIGARSVRWRAPINIYGGTMLRKLEADTAGTDSYRSILRSTALIGASSAIVLVASLVRVKVLAVLLGPAGIGLMALYSSVADLAVAIAGLGVQQSGVRQIAQAAGTGDAKRIAHTATAVRSISLLLALAGAVGLAALCVPVSALTFGTTHYALPVALLGLVVLLRIYTAGETAAVQGRRRIGDLSALNIIGAVASVCASVPLVMAWGEDGIVPALVLTALVTAGVAWWFGRKAASGRAVLSRALLRREVRDLLRLGFAFLVSAILTMGAAFAVRIIVLHESGVWAAGLYQAAWAIAGLYVGFVLQAMGTDFYPRLTGLADNEAEMSRLVNEQTQVSLLLAGPGVIATITLAPLAMTVLYSHDFTEASGLLRLLCLGMLLRVVAWPMGFIVLAKGWQAIFIITEVVATAIHVGLAALLVPWIGPEGAGVAFLSLYLCHSALIYCIVRMRCGFSFSGTNLALLAMFLPTGALAYAGFAVLPFWGATTLGLAVTAGLGLFSLVSLARLTTGRVLPPLVLRVLRGWR